MKTSANRLSWGIISLLLLHFAVLGYLLASVPIYSDEIYHYPQIQEFAEGGTSIHPRITTLPTYHVVVATLARLGGAWDLATLRWISLAYSILLVPVGLWLLQQLRQPNPYLRMLQLVFIPVLYPYLFLLYTDSLALITLLLSVAMLFKGRYPTAAGVGLLAALIRQTNIVWLFFSLVVIGIRQRHASFKDKVGKLLPFVLAAIAVSIIFLAQGSVASGDVGRHQLGLHTGNVFFALFLYALIYLPEMGVTLRERSWFAEPKRIALVVLLAGIYYSTFRVDHEFNQISGFLRNDVLRLVMQRLEAYHIFFAITALAAVSLSYQQYQERWMQLLLPFAVALLLPAHLIEHRYTIPIFALYGVFHAPRSLWFEVTQTIWMVLLSVVVAYGVFTGLFAL